MTTVLTSIHGKRVGLDADNYFTTETGIKAPVYFEGTSGSEFDNQTQTTATVSSTGTTITNHGVTQMTSTAAKSYLLADPTHTRQRKVLSQTSSSTAGLTITTVGGTNGTGYDGLNHIAKLLGRGQALALQAASTLGWMVISKDSSVTLTTV